MVGRMSKPYHIQIGAADINGATIALLPGDPGRVEKIANKGESPKFLASHREYTSYLTQVGKKPVLICSTGIGGPSTSICVEELAQIGIRTFIRVGTTGAIQPHVKVGDLVITQGAVRLDGASHHFAPSVFPAVADFETTCRLVKACEVLKYSYHVGITASSDTFYQGQERYDSYSKYVPPHLQGSLKQWQQLGVLNFEMESATLYTMGAALQLKTACISGVIVNRTASEKADPSIMDEVQNRVIEAAVKSITQV